MNTILEFKNFLRKQIAQLGQVRFERFRILENGFLFALINCDQDKAYIVQVCRDPSGEGLFLEITHAETPAIGFSRFSDGVFTRALLSFESLSFSDVLPIKSIWSEIWITSSAYIKDPANVEESKAVIAAALNFVRQCAPLQLKTTMWMVRGHDER